MDIGIPFWIAFYIWIGSEFIIAIRNKRMRGTITASKKDKGSLFIILVGIWLGSAIAFQLHFFHLGWVGQSIANIGTIMMIAGVAFRLWAIRILGKHFSLAVSVDDNHTMIEKGPYKYIRHPSYTGTLVTLIGLGLGLNSWLASCVLLVIFAIIYGYRIKVEEAALAAQFQRAYEEYRKRTWRLIPFLY
ncbi:isoprenylcysteine carboxylmethyltransferase family protein [Aneurinibacillus sp. Ricciae_BoGa-3]|uniref:methyltransferase family protein n=1 Tax=Aneurinibacillus sp. Ricciae_BoGa-3 TaxID=3022697 RepID=UPI002341B117|nr:isoprenylcysteine carboxylmethyltransferase family protein [Aneurinibacillus sp. Ricciae_BoGa-3]WCK54491.1 isoprenylcysteine carboxylmethyltransferase family protein [Aneurinibacillus sp. Ricciae_BoGa-3]